MPCLNEAETVATCVRKAVKFIADSGVSGEVVVADNGSTDGSRQLAAEAGARVVPIPERGYGNALMGGIIAPGAMPPLHRYLGTPVLSFIGRLFFRSNIGDFNCGLRGFRRDSAIALGLQATGMEFASEMIVKAALAQQKITEVPTTLAKDGRSRPPHLNTWRDGWRHLRFLLLFSPRWLFFYPGLALLVIGLG